MSKTRLKPKKDLKEEISLKIFKNKKFIKKEIEQNEDSQAALTHFLQNSENDEVSVFFKGQAFTATRKILEFKYPEQRISEGDVEAAFQYDLFEIPSFPFPHPPDYKFTFIDLFAGIGGIRLAYQDAGGKCVFSSEWDKFAKETYAANFGEVPFGDITKIDEEEIPEHDVLLAGFPCQPFSIAGVSKKNSLGRKHGFLDETQGTLFFDIARILEHRRPKAFMLENVKNLLSHDKGRTFKIIESTLTKIGYNIHYEVLNGSHFVPQNRERIFIIGFHKDLGDVDFKFPKLPERKSVFKDILQKDVDLKYTLSDKLWKYLQDYAEKHRKRGNGFGYGLAKMDGISRTLSARYYKDGSEILISQKGKNPRRLTPRECARLQGFPKEFKIPVSDHQAYKQFGNSVTVPLIFSIARQLVKALFINESHFK